jgi:hypothetical protein
MQLMTVFVTEARDGKPTVLKLGKSPLSTIWPADSGRFKGGAILGVQPSPFESHSHCC